MVNVPAQGELWWVEEPELGRRPVLVVTRSWATDLLGAIVVAPVTRTIRGIPTELRLGRDDGLRDECVASFDNLMTTPRSIFVERAGGLADGRVHELCERLAAVADC